MAGWMTACRPCTVVGMPRRAAARTSAVCRCRLGRSARHRTGPASAAPRCQPRPSPGTPRPCFQIICATCSLKAVSKGYGLGGMSCSALMGMIIPSQGAYQSYTRTGQMQRLAQGRGDDLPAAFTHTQAIRAASPSDRCYPQLGWGRLMDSPGQLLTRPHYQEYFIPP